MIWLSSDLRFKQFWVSIDVCFKWFWLSVELNFNWGGCQIDLRFMRFGCQSVWGLSDSVVNWSEIPVSWLSTDVWFKWFWWSVDVNFKWCGCQLIWDSSDSVVSWSEIQMIWLSIDLRFKWVGCQLIWDSSGLDVKWFEVQVIWLSTDVWFKWFLSNEALLRDFLQKRSFEAQKRSFSARLPSKLKLWRSKTKLFCETSFKIEALKLKTKLFCETSFKIEALERKNETFLRDFLQKWRVEDQKQNFSARLPSKMNLWRSKTKLFCETSFKNDILTGHLTSEFQYVLTIFKWMLQKYCACHEKVEPRHAKSCDMKSATLPRFQRRRLQTSTSQSAKSLRLPRETHRFRPSSNPPRLPTFLQPSRTPAPATYFATCRNPCACHAKHTCNLKKRPEPLVF